VNEFIDVVYPIEMGGAVPLDYRYCVYSAVKTSHHDMTERGWQLCPISGTREGDLLRLESGDSEVRVRMPKADTAHVNIGSVLRVSDFVLVLGDPFVQPIQPCPVLSSNLVIVTSDDEPRGVRGVDYGVHVGKRIGALLGHLGVGVEIGERRPMHVSGSRLFGHSVTIKGLSDNESIRLQSEGMGQKRAMGCGVFCADH